MASYIILEHQVSKHKKWQKMILRNIIKKPQWESCESRLYLTQTTKAWREKEFLRTALGLACCLPFEQDKLTGYFPVIKTKSANIFPKIKEKKNTTFMVHT